MQNQENTIPASVLTKMLAENTPLKIDEINAKIREVSEEPLYIEVFDARCPDASESNSVEN